MLQVPDSRSAGVDTVAFGGQPDATLDVQRGDWTTRSARLLEESLILLRELHRSLAASQALVDRSRLAVSSTRAWLDSLRRVTRERMPGDMVSRAYSNTEPVVGARIAE
jgi:hypothetical protein